MGNIHCVVVAADKYPMSYGGQPIRGQPSYGNGQDFPPQGGREDRLPRSISTANLKSKVDQCRDVMMRDLVTKPPLGGTSFFTSTPSLTLSLPPLSDPAFRKYVYDRLTDRPMQKHLVEDGHILNWCNTVSELIPLNTLRDGNCLLHAASLGMWGFQDREVTLRGALSAALHDVTENTLYNRWKYNREIENQRMGLELESHQWNEEWHAMVRQASSKVQIGGNFESLDDFHIFVLANVLRRPIILYAATKIHSMQTGGTLQEINFQGVYLPLLWEPATCKKNPLPLAYDGGHFCALVPESAKRWQDEQVLLPLVDYYGKQLTIKFTLTMEDSTSLAMDYLRPIQVGHGGSPYITTTHIVCAKLEVTELPPYLKSLVSNFVDSCWDAYSASKKVTVESGGGGGRGISPRGPVAEPGGGGERTKCINNCGRYSDAQHSFLCTECHCKARERESHADRSPPRAPHQNSREHPDGSKWNEAGQGTSRGGGGSVGTVKCPQCAEPGMPQLLGMCQRCFGNSTGDNAGGKNDAIYEMLPGETASQGSPGESQPPPDVPLPRNPKERSLCRRLSCKYYGSVDNMYYCSQCFNSDMENIIKEGPPVRPGTTPTRAESGHEPHDDQPASGEDPPKCYQCHEFFANVEYMGLCNSCFMKSTLSGGPLPRGPQDSERQQSREAEPQPSRRPDRRERFYNPTAPKSVYNPTYGAPSSGRSSRVPTNPTAPVTTLESEMADMTMRDRCFMCTGGQMGDSAQFTVCRNHAMDLFKIMQQGGKEGVRRENEVQPKPSYAKQYEAPQSDVWAKQPSEAQGDPYEPRAFGNEVRSKPYDTTSSFGNEVRHRSSSFGGNDLDNPQYQHVSTGRLGSVSEQERRGRGANISPPGTNVIAPLGYESYRDDRRGRGSFGNEQGYPPHQSPGHGNEHRYGNEQGWPPPSGNYDQRPSGREPGGRHGNDLDHPPKQGYTSEQGRRRSNDFTANGPGHPYREANGQQRHVQAVGRGADGGATGGSDPAVKPKVKALCATTGCSFKGYEPLKGLCPDCYIEEYKKYPDYYSPDDFPLV